MKKPTPDQFEVVMLDFYRPHKRVYQPMELFNHKTGEYVVPPRRVKQSFVAECDINNILKQYSATGQLRHINAKAAAGAYIDLPDNLDYQASLQIIKDGETAFASLPSKTRDRFNNDPSAFLEFMADPKNQDEMVKLGLATSTKSISPSVPPAHASTSESSASTHPTSDPKSTNSPPKA